MNRLYLSVVFLFISLTQVSASEKRYEGVDLRNNHAVSVKFSSKKFLVAYFLNRGCPCSQAHFDHLNDLQKKYKNFSFIGFHSNKTINKESAMEYFSKYKIDFPILLDKDLIYANQFKAVKTPHVFVLDKEGKTFFQGGATDSRDPKRAHHFYLRDALASLSRGENVKVRNAKTIGCYIQR